MKNKIKVAIVSKYFPPNIRGGGEISAYNLAKGLSDSGVEVHVITSENITAIPGSGFVLHPIIKPNILPGVFYHIGNNELFYWNTYKTVSAFLKNNPGIDIVHAMNMDTIPGVVFAASKHGVKSVATINSHWLTCPYGYMLKMYDGFSVCDGKCNLLSAFRCYRHSSSLLEQLFGPLYSKLQMIERQYSAKKLDGVVCISKNIHSYVKTIFGDKLTAIIPNICEFTEPINYNNKFESDILFVGALGKFKGCEYVIQAMPEIIKKYPECIFRVIGDGDRFNEFKKMTQRLDVSDNVIFEGFVSSDEIDVYFSKTRIVVFPSIVPETFGRVAAEAMAFCKPVIGSNTGAIPENVKHMETGVIVEPANVPEIADAVLYLLGNHEVAKKMGITGKLISMHKYSTEFVTNNYLRMYQKVLYPYLK
ncbi:glycosyltransferase family 4 protein [Methanolobus sp. WCC4]|uniref:glycosyltransferase family 4 protein n=1 Tax=Methanolobus sp. WCC4 TaxID=3125784 RepID=UPI0030F6B6C8